ncbi:hypothetical protein BU17DRAFT_74982 [Hysterangium stoloniferum]|nr:hypothetical protein BU17DRAFT_74982 [Hysterangium stoloniferum]
MIVANVVGSNVTLKAVIGTPRKDIVYAVFTEFLTAHKDPQERFVIYPQLSLKWKPDDPQDKRSEVPDVGIGNFTLPGTAPPFVLRFGVEAKRAVQAMHVLPPPQSLLGDRKVLLTFHRLFFQAKNQAKAAIKNHYPINGNTVDWILLVGPYWRTCTFGPFSEVELTVRGHKPTESADFVETLEEQARMATPPLALPNLFLLSTAISRDHLHALLAKTDLAATALNNQLM